MVHGTAGPPLMWSQEMPDAARCLPAVLSLPGSRRAPPVRDMGQGRSLTQSVSGLIQKQRLLGCQSGRQCFKSPPPHSSEGETETQRCV